MELNNSYFTKAELAYRRDQVLAKRRPVSRRRRERADAVRRVLSHLR